MCSCKRSHWFLGLSEIAAQPRMTSSVQLLESLPVQLLCSSNVGFEQIGIGDPTAQPDSRFNDL